MKKHLLLLAAFLVGLVSCQYDDESLWKAVDNLDKRVTALEELCNNMNENILSLQTIVNALQQKDLIESVIELPDNGGYTINFTSGKFINIYNGEDGATPIISVKQDSDGIYYWTVNEQWLIVDGRKVKAIGTDGVDGESGEDGITPRLKIEEGYWYISYDNEVSWEQLGKATGENGADGINVFKSVTEDAKNVYFTLADDSIITIPKVDTSEFAISFDTTDVAIMDGGTSKTISYTITDATENTIVKTISQDGWKATVNPLSADRGTITITAPDPIAESEILVFANDGSYRTVMASLNCMQGQISIADNSFDVTSNGGMQAIKVTTNLDYMIEIPDDATSWLSLAPVTRAMRDDTINIEIAANNGIQRYATVALKDENGCILQTIIFRQLGLCTEVNVETKGDLENVLASYDYANIESLKITGVLNDVDFLFIYRMMPKLRNLDISEVAITTLPAKAFYNSTNVENLILPKTLTLIGESMFYRSKLKSIKISASVKTIGEGSFYQCSYLKSVTFEDGSQLKTIDGDYYYYSGAFADCVALTSIEIPASVETIEATAFKGCSSLKSVIFEDGSQLKTIGGQGDASGAFTDCVALASIEIPASVENIGAGAFNKCSSLASVTFEERSRLKTIGGRGNDSGAFTDCAALTSIEIPASVENIGAGAFNKCSSLASVTFEERSRLKTIGGRGNDSGAFTDCAALTSIEIPASVETIKAAAFKGCSSLASVTFEEGSQLKTIGGWGNDNHFYGAFEDCVALTSIEIPASVETIKAAAFKGCSSLASVTFEERSQLKTIGGGYYSYSSYYGAFADCAALTSIEIPASVETIEATAFKGCSSLESVTFKEGSLLKTIGGGYYSSYYYGAFANLKKLMTVDMSACTYITSIGECAFYGDSKLRLFKIGTEIPASCGSSAFYGINKYSVLKVPSGCADSYKAANEWKRFSSITGLDE